MSAHESMEQADQAKEASSQNRKIALLIALSETLGKGAQTESLAKNVEASNLWAFFQAKSIRHTVVQTAADQSKLGLGAAGDDAAKAAAQKQIDAWQKTAERYRSDPKGATLPPRNIITSNLPPPPSRSASCWPRRRSSPALSSWPGSRVS